MAIKVYTPDLIEIVNNVPEATGDDMPTLVAELGTWKTETESKTGISFEVFGSLTPLLSAAEARRLSKWLMQAAETMDGERKDIRRGQKKRRHDEDDE